MITLHSGSGAQDYWTEDLAVTEDQWLKIRATACKRMRARNEIKAIDYLNALPFRLYDATNGFGDRFAVLVGKLPFDQYHDFATRTADPIATRREFGAIAHAISELIDTFVRFIVVEVDDSGENPIPVSEPILENPSVAVEHALADVRHLLDARGPISVVDRVHTAFHGYLKSTCSEEGIEFSADASVTQLFKSLRTQHTRLSGARNEDIDKILRSLSAVLDAVNTLRNRASLAHANNELLGNAEAMLVVNAVRTLFNYVHDKVGSPEVVTGSGSSTEASDDDIPF